MSLPGLFAVRAGGPAVARDAPAGDAVFPTTAALIEEEKEETEIRMWEV